MKAVLLTFGLAALFAFLVWADVQEQREWDAYAAQHHCHAVGKREGSSSVSYGADSKGNLIPVFNSEPDQTVFACDAGEIHIR